MEEVTSDKKRKKNPENEMSSQWVLLPDEEDEAILIFLPSESYNHTRHLGTLLSFTVFGMISSEQGVDRHRHHHHHKRDEKNRFHWWLWHSGSVCPWVRLSVPSLSLLRLFSVFITIFYRLLCSIPHFIIFKEFFVPTNNSIPISIWFARLTCSHWWYFMY